MGLLRGLELVQNGLVLVGKNIGDVTFLVGDDGIKRMVFPHSLETKRTVIAVGKTRTQTNTQVLFHVGVDRLG